jgi:hypothetical protein
MIDVLGGHLNIRVEYNNIRGEHITIYLLGGANVPGAVSRTRTMWLRMICVASRAGMPKPKYSDLLLNLYTLPWTSFSGAILFNKTAS